MLTTLYAHVEVPRDDDTLVRELRRLLPTVIDDSTATMYRLGLANEAGQVYRLVLVFGEFQRNQALAALRGLALEKHGPDLRRGLDAVFAKAGVLPSGAAS